MTKAKAALNARQQCFVEEYLVDLNATQAYIRAGYAARGNVAEVNAARLLRNAKVQICISKAQADRLERTKVDADWVLARLSQEAMADLADLYDETGRVKPIREWPLIWRQGLVTGVETFPEEVGKDAEGNPVYGTAYRIKLAARDKRLELLGKHVYVSAFREQVDHTSSDGSMSPPTLADFYSGMAQLGKSDTPALPAPAE